MTIYRRFGTTNGQYLSTFRLHIKDDDENESPHEHPYPLRGCNSDLAQYSNTPALHHSARPDSRTRTTTRTRTKRLVTFHFSPACRAQDTQSGSARDSATSLPDKHNSRLHKRRWDDGCLKVRSRRKEQRCWRRW